MAKLGSDKNPLILRLVDESKASEIAAVCDENGWTYIIGIEPDKSEDLSDLERKLTPPVRHVEAKVGRNEPCPCGSGKKYKKCCALNNP
jgi:SWIM/SEC-C metal-binding protein